MRISLTALTICLLAGSLSATPLQEQLLLEKIALNNMFPAAIALQAEDDEDQAINPGRSRFLKSLLLPGWGQFEEGHWIKAGIYLAVEATFITGAVLAYRQGVERDNDFKDYANTHWSFDDYRLGRNHSHEWGSSEEVPDTSYFGDVVDGSQNGSHELPGSWEEGWTSEDDPWMEHFNVDETQQYYEMIGKYAQFGRGWDDYGNNVGSWDGSWQGIHYFSPSNLYYMHLRDLSNESFRLSTNLIMGTLLNHFVSAIDQILFGDNGKTQLSAEMNGEHSLVKLQFTL